MKLHYQGIEQQGSKNSEKQTFEYNSEPEEELATKPLSAKISQYLSENADLIAAISILTLVAYWYISSQSTKTLPMPPRKKTKRHIKTQQEYDRERINYEMQHYKRLWRMIKHRLGIS